MIDRKQLVGNLAAAGAYTIFGLNIVTCKDIANYGIIAPFPLFTLRSAGAFILFTLFSWFGPEEKVERRDILKIMAASFIGLFIPQVTFLAAITVTTAIDTAIIGTLSPIFTMFIAAIVLKEPITFKKAAGVLISLGGVLLMIFNSVTASNGVQSSSAFGIMLLLLNALGFASYLGIFRPLISKYSVVTFMKWMFLFSLILSLPFSIKGIVATKFSSMPVSVILEIGFVVLFGTFISYFLVPIGQKNIRPTIVSMYSYLQPIIAAVVAIAAGIDTFTWKKVLAAVLVILGVVIVNKSRAAYHSSSSL